MTEPADEFLDLIDDLKATWPWFVVIVIVFALTMAVGVSLN